MLNPRFLSYIASYDVASTILGFTSHAPTVGLLAAVVPVVDRVPSATAAGRGRARVVARRVVVAIVGRRRARVVARAGT